MRYLHEIIQIITFLYISTSDILILIVTLVIATLHFPPAGVIVFEKQNRLQAGSLDCMCNLLSHPVINSHDGMEGLQEPSLKISSQRFL